MRPVSPDAVRADVAQASQLSWAQVFDGSDDPGVEALRGDAPAAARSHFDRPDPYPAPKAQK